jgi:hypothetical protein
VDGVPTVGDGHDPLSRLHGAYISATGRGGALLPPRKGAANGASDRRPMSVSAMHLAALPSRRRRTDPPAMTRAITTSPRQPGAVATRRFTLPVVREIPIPPADRPGDRTW